MTDTLQDPSRFRQASRQTPADQEFRKGMTAYITDGVGTNYEKIENFPKYLSRQMTARYMALYECFKLAYEVQGDIIECGVNWGGALMLFAQLSAVMEPVNLQRRVVGFDTFSGFPGLDDKDRKATLPTGEMRQGGFNSVGSYEDLLRAIELFDVNRFNGHIQKVQLVSGDACQTMPKFLADNPHTVVSLLHLDFDLYAPTAVALECFLPRMPKGAVIVFDEINNRSWPGETVALLEKANLRDLRIRRFPFEPYISYAVLD